MIPSSVLNQLADIVGHKNIIVHKEALSEYATDGTKLEFPPDAAVFPADTGEVSRILTLADTHGFPVIPRGAGTGMSGGALPVQGGLVMGMARLNRILSIDADNLICKVEPGVITADLQAAVEEVDLFYPPDPASLNVSTIGGNVAECAGGLRAVKYGVTRDYVLGLTIVLPTGEILKTGVETMKGVAGYDLTRLIIGSEGTLAVITNITLRLIPKPAGTQTMITFFPDVRSAAQTVTQITREKIIPTILEFLDKTCLECVREEMNISIPENAQSMLLVEVDGDECALQKDSKKIAEVCERNSCIVFEAASTPDAAERLWEARRNVSPSLLRLRPHKISEDIVVPRNLLPELLKYLGELSLKHGLPVPAFGHAGDGNIHVNVMLDKNNPNELDQAQVLIQSLFAWLIQMGGTITGEHGIGMTKSPYLEMEISRPGIDLMHRIKTVFDPKGILNPGKIFV